MDERMKKLLLLMATVANEQGKCLEDSKANAERYGPPIIVTKGKPF